MYMILLLNKMENKMYLVCSIQKKDNFNHKFDDPMNEEYRLNQTFYRKYIDI